MPRWTEQPAATLALISVPGDYAAGEARKALRAGLDVMIFSDNVPLEEEVALKREAKALGRLVMGPDCGTAIIDGTPLAFANRVPRGDIGVIGASGTGIQEVTSLIAQGGKGISQAIGVGGPRSRPRGRRALHAGRHRPARRRSGHAAHRADLQAAASGGGARGARAGGRERQAFYHLLSRRS